MPAIDPIDLVLRTRCPAKHAADLARRRARRARDPELRGGAVIPVAGKAPVDKRPSLHWLDMERWLAFEHRWHSIGAACYWDQRNGVVRKRVETGRGVSFQRFDRVLVETGENTFRAGFVTSTTLDGWIEVAIRGESGRWLWHPERVRKLPADW